MITNKTSTILITCLLLISTLAVITRYKPIAAQSPQATLTGNISDRGVDTNGNGEYDFLEVTVEINVTEPGEFRIVAYDLMDEVGGTLFLYTENSSYLNMGLQYLSLSFLGAAIQGATFNPKNISEIYLYTEPTFPPIYSIHDAALSRVYYWTEFEVYAYFSGNVSDRGIDTDGDGFLNYLEVGIEINVTKAGKYEINVLGFLEEISGNPTRYYYDTQWVTNDFTVGTQIVYFNFSCVKIAHERFSPTNISDVYCYDTAQNYQQISHIYGASLSTRYDYSLFEAPQDDMQVNFDVYPNGTLGLSGAMNFTNIYPPANDPLINATIGISTNGNVTIGSAVGTFDLPNARALGSWPYNSTAAHLTSQYDNGMLNATLAAMIFFPPEGSRTYPLNSSNLVLNAVYSNGKVNVDLSGDTVVPPYDFIFPLNATDFTVRADSVGKDLKGNITFHTISGFPLADVVVNFNGNSTYLYFTGNVNVAYGTYSGLQINSTILDEMLANFASQIPGQGPDSLYNKTFGFLECTQQEMSKTPWFIGPDEVGANVEFNVTTIGNYTGFLARLLFPSGVSTEQSFQEAYAAMESARSSVQNASLLLNYHHDSGIGDIDMKLTSDVKVLWQNALQLVPPTVPPAMRTQIEAWLKVANLTADAIEDFSMNASYSSSELKLTLLATMLANVTQLKSDTILILPDFAPPEMHDLYKSFFNTTYCTLNSSTTTLYFFNGTGSFDASWTLQGDFKAELNHAKRFYIATTNASSPWSLPWTLRMLNETEIDINNFQLEYKMGTDWIYASFDGLILHPQKDDLDFIRFRLYNWLNLTTDAYQPPQEFEKLKITITGKSDANQTILLYSHPGVPNPNGYSLDYRTMTWENTSLTSLKELLFLIAFEGRVDYNARTYYVPIFTNSTVTAFGFDADAKKLSFTVSGTASTGFCNVTIPKILLNATTLDNWTIKFDGTQLLSQEFNVTENAEYVFVYLNYTHSEHVIEIVGTEVPAIPEFQTNIILPLFMTVTLLAVIVCKRKHTSKVNRR